MESNKHIRSSNFDQAFDRFLWVVGKLEITFNNHMVVEKPVKKIALNGGRQLLDTIIEDIDKIERASLPSRWAWIIEN